jgi:hypothetical protein
VVDGCQFALEEQTLEAVTQHCQFGIVPDHADVYGLRCRTR